MHLTVLPEFDIRNFADQLVPAKGKNRYVCPVCDGDNLTFDSNHYQGYTCWNEDSNAHRAEIKEALSPFKQALAKAKNGQADQRQRFQPHIFQPKSCPQSVALPSEIVLARLEAPALDSPQPQARTDFKRGQIQVTTYSYSDTQWVERRQWDNPKKLKGHSKDFFPWHMGDDGKPICKKGDRVWMPYRWDEAIAAAVASHANALLVVEGEGCVEAYRSLGFAAVTLQGSAWGTADLEFFAHQVKAHDLTVVFHPDHDPTGQTKAAAVEQACHQAGVPYLMLNSTDLCPNLPEKGDVVDMLKLMSQHDFIQRLEAQVHAALDRWTIESRDRPSELPPVQRGQTPAEIAAEMAEDYRDRLAWNDEAGLWYRYEAELPGVWSVESDTAIGALVVAEFENRMGLTYKASGIEQTIKILRWKLIVKKWEQPTHLLPFRNGVLDVQTQTFSAHAPGYRFTWSLPRDHNPLAADWSVIETWMDEATGHDANFKQILLCWLNACFKGRADLQRIFYATGPGGTGKGTFIRLAGALVGKQNQHSSSISDWCGNRFETANAYKKRLLLFADEDKYAGGLGNLKKVSGGDAIRGEIKNKQAFEFIFEGMVMIASNYPIFPGDTSTGIYRRLLMMPFTHVIPAHQRRDMEKVFAPHLAALTNHVLSIPDEVVTATLHQCMKDSPDAIDQAWEWRMRQDSVAAWLNECVLLDPVASERVGNDRADATTLYGSYYAYCEKTGSKAKGSREFSPTLLELVNHDPALHWGVTKKRFNAGFLMQGLRLRTEADRERPYCLEALSQARWDDAGTDLPSVGLSPGVGSSVGSSVGSEALLGKDRVGCVGSTDLLEENTDLNPQPQTETLLSAEVSQKEEGSPYTPYTTQVERNVEPYTAALHEQDAAPYTQSQQPKPLNPEQLERAVEMMRQIDSMETFVEFHDRFQKCTLTQQRQIYSAFSERGKYETQQRFYAFWEMFDAVQTVSASAESDLTVQGQIKLSGLSLQSQEAAISDWEPDVYS